MFRSDNSIVPSIMFHSVGLLDDRYWSTVNVSEPVDIFRRKMEILKRFKHEFLHWHDLYAYVESNSPRVSPAIMLSFDDGYLDNWVYVFPILKELGIKATIVVNPDFVDPSTDVRPNYDDVKAGRVRESELQAAGFLNWAEMREMEASGLVDIQSHTMTHTWYFSGPELVDFHNPLEFKYPWMAWNQEPGQKPFSKTADQRSLVRWGTPIYEHKRSLICRRYFPPEAVLSELLAYVDEEGGEKFFHDSEWHSKLLTRHTKLMLQHKAEGQFESDNDYKQRVTRELADAKAIIDRALNKSVSFVCWPGGAYNETVVSVARELGFKSWTLASHDQESYRNTAGGNPCQVRRMSSSVKYFTPQGADCGYAGEYFFLSNIERHKGSVLGKWIGRFLRVIAMTKARFA